MKHLVTASNNQIGRQSTDQRSMYTCINSYTGIDPEQSNTSFSRPNNKKFNIPKFTIMKNSILILTLLITTAFSSQAQTNQSIAAGFPAVNGLHITSEMASKLIRLELIKLEKYSVYDEYDMRDAILKDPTLSKNCLSKNCLVRLGQELKVDYTFSGSIDALGNKIVITMKMIDVNSETLFKTSMMEFENQETELQRMIEIVVRNMHGLNNDPLLVDLLKFKNQPITSTNDVGKINNSGPRIGYAVMTGEMYEFATRNTSTGGMGMFPAVTMIGYQFEGQYVGTENFSGLIECIVNVSGLEQGRFIPTISLMNGFRFGRAGWEFAFGPGFGLTRESKGFFDTKGLFGDEGAYVSQKDWQEYAANEFSDADSYPEYHSNGWFEAPSVSSIEPSYNFNQSHLDSRGGFNLNTMFVFAVGRTFRAGALNIPVNVFYTARRNGGMTGVNVGFNVMKSKSTVKNKKI